MLQVGGGLHRWARGVAGGIGQAWCTEASVGSVAVFEGSLKRNVKDQDGKGTGMEKEWENGGKGQEGKGR